MRLRILHSTVLVVLFLALSAASAFTGGASEGAAGSARGEYLAERGQIIPPSEVMVDSYIASIDYDYPVPEENLAVYTYAGNRTISTAGGPQIIQIGVKGSKREFADLPPLNLAFVVDAGVSMADDEKIAWVKESFDILLGKLRDVDFLSIVVFDDDARVLVPPTPLNVPENRTAMREAVQAITPTGSSNLEAGLELGYQQVMANYRNGYVNRVLFLSDGTEMSARLRTAGAKTGDLRVSLLWDNRNDLDLHVVEPSGQEIYYGNPQSMSTGGMLDVDMNVGGETTKPVENVFWAEGHVPEGTLSVFIRLFSYKDPEDQDTNYTVEIYDRGETTRYTGRIPGGSDYGTQVDIAEVTYRRGEAGAQALRGVLDVARTYKELGISVSTIGVGQHFDVQLMTDLAVHGGGSSRFVANREKMAEIFDTELDRMVVPAATDVDITVTLGDGVALGNTWGYQHVVDENRISYRMETVHNGDYETILLRVVAPAVQPGVEAVLATVASSYSTVGGQRITLTPAEVSVVGAGDVDPLSGVSTYRVLQSSAMLEFAETLREIGEFFFDGPLPRYPTAEDVRTALELTRESKAQLLSVQRRVDGADFSDEIAILDHYFSTLGQHLDLDVEEVTAIVEDNSLPIDQPTRTTITHLSNLFAEVGEHLSGRDLSVAVVPFFIRTNIAYPEAFNDGFRSYVQQVATATLASSEGIRLIDTDRIEAELSILGLGFDDLRDTVHAVETARGLGTDTIVTGTMIEMKDSFIVFARVIDTVSEEVLAAAQVVLDKETVLADLLGPS